MLCPSCGEPAPEGANWCEACGSDLAATPEVGATPNVKAAPCVACGATDIDTDGYCMECGRKQPAERDHVLVASGPLVGCSDRGRRHHENEDAVAVRHVELALPEGATRLALVVCDGVSSTPGSAAASQAAVDAAAAALVEPADDLGAAMTAATTAAQLAASNAPEVQADALHPPSSTFVAAVADAVPGAAGVALTVGWVGDSRAYWIGADATEGDAVLLTTDHEINGSLTRWIGADAQGIDGGAVVPDIVHVQADGPGTLVVCSDGMWRYADEPEAMAALVRRLRNQNDELDVVAGAMIDTANAGGGHDNISVALCSFPLTAPSLEMTRGADGSAPQTPHNTTTHDTTPSED